MKNNDATEYHITLVSIKEIFDFFDPRRASQREHRREDRENFAEMLSSLDNINYQGENYNSMSLLTALCAHNVPKGIIEEALKHHPNPFQKDNHGLTALDVVKYFRPEQFAMSNTELTDLLETYAAKWQKRHKTTHPIYSPPPAVTRCAALEAPANREHMVIECVFREYQLDLISTQEMLGVIEGLKDINIINRYYNDITPLMAACAYDVPREVIAGVLEKNPDPKIRDCHGYTAADIIEKFRSPQRAWKISTPAVKELLESYTKNYNKALQSSAREN